MIISGYDTEYEELQKQLDLLMLERKPKENEQKRIDKVIKANTNLKNYIGSMKLYVKSNSGEEVPVNEETIVGFPDSMNFIISKREMINSEIVIIDNKIGALKRRLQESVSLFRTETRIASFDQSISKVEIDYIATEHIINKLEKRRQEIKELIRFYVKNDNDLVYELHSTISKYALEMGVDERYVRPNNDYIFTNDLKSLSGTILHKIVFAFKLAYINSVYIHTGIKLPIILDSPSGREVKKEAVDEMIRILARDFYEHQIIIASINQYNLPDLNVIEIEDRLLDF